MMLLWKIIIKIKKKAPILIPFNTTSQRSKLFEGENKIPGPGAYSLTSNLSSIRRNSDPKVCFFFDREQFEENQINNLYEAYGWYTSTYGSTVHMTMIFNIFFVVDI